ncbi:ribonuclease H-like domain-containing protein [Bacillus sp. D386]|uniref:ribonuclease H-like domain-containing protein n=1 Tax=Bacillus sp. D386 TaxID=2587155 RepID=UPI00111E6FD7|nr:ribonuclease H-like domain-containing protein [Bacillus sp. D386]
MSIKNKLNRMKKHLNTNVGEGSKKRMEVCSEPEPDTPIKNVDIPFFEQWSEFGAFPVIYENEYCLIREVSYPLDYQHGKYTFDMLPQIVKIWNESDLKHPLSAKGFEANQMFFFDTETTGLGGGAGTSIFLLGYAFLEDENIKVRQHFLPRPGFEIPFYKTFLEKVNYETLVTYNGKAFDWPQVVTQHTLLRQHLPKLPNFGHFDLYHASRRLWKNKLDRVKLSVVEKEVLGFERKDDVPGYLAPIIYFDYIDRKNPEAIFKIMKHNEWDVLSLITLYIHQSALLLNDDALEHEDSFELARWFSYLKDRERAIGSFEKGISESKHDEERLNVLFHLANEHKKNKNDEAAVKLWEEACDAQTPVIVCCSLIELAKYFEHKKKDYAKALEYTNKALVKIREYSFHKHGIHEKSTLHRICRLERKLDKEEIGIKEN